MKSATTVLSLALLSAVAVSTSRGAAAGDAPDNDLNQLATIIVTAQKRSEDIQTVPMSVSVISAKQLEDLHATQLLDFGGYIPGFQVLSAGVPGLAQLAIRGIPPLGSSGTVATYIDDTPLSQSSLYGAGASTTLDLLPYDFSSFDVLRGPQGTLYGASALGGLIKYISKVPDLNQFSVNFGADTFGVDGAGHIGFGTRIRLNAPLLPGQLGMSASFSQQNTPGYINNSQTGVRDQNAYQQQAARLALLWQPSDDVSLNVAGLQQRVSADSASYVALNSATLQPVGGKLRDNNYLPESFNSTIDYFNASLKVNLGWADFVSATSYSDARSVSVTDATLEYGVLLPELGAPAGNSGYGTNANLDKTTEELRLTSKPSDRFEWLVGTFYDNEESTNNQIVTATAYDGTPVPGLDPLALAALPSTYREYAVFGDVTYKFGSLFDLSGGVRYAHNSQTFEQVGSGAIVPTATVPGSSKQGVWTYSVSPEFHINPNTMVYLRVATGYQPGGPNLALPGVPPSVAADTLTSYEVGLKSTFADRRVMIDVDAFYIDWNKIQVSDTNNGLTYIVNGGTARSEGLEFSSLFSPIERLRLGVNAAYTDAILTQDIPSIGGESGDPLPYIPKWSASATADYSFPLTEQWTARMGGGMHYTGSRETAVAHSPLAYPLSSYTGVDLNADVENDHWTVRLFIKNAFNRDSYVNAFPIENAATGAVSQIDAVPLQPRTIGVGFDAKF